MTVNAYAKINFTLDVLRRRPDHYYDLRMVNQTVSLCDVLDIDLTDGGGISLECPPPFSRDNRNLAYRAAEMFADACGFPIDVEIKLQKFIPTCAGLGGGSADAAAVLRTLNYLTGEPLSFEELCEVGGAIGADVPFCLHGGTAVCEGKGDIITPVEPVAEINLVIVKPSVALSTGDVFSRVLPADTRHFADTDGFLSARREGDLASMAMRCFNALEDVAGRMTKAVSIARAKLIEQGALGACMTGSGSAVFGVFGTAKAAENAAANITEQCFAVTTVDDRYR